MMSSPTPIHFRRLSARRADEDYWRFERSVLPHLDAAYNLARWLIHGDCDAQNVVREAVVGAMCRIDGLPRECARTWLLLLVRQACFLLLKEKPLESKVALDDVDAAWASIAATATDEPRVSAIRKSDKEQTNAAIAGLPVAYREVLVLRELEDLSYAEIVQITDTPLGTVMSRLARARGLMKAALGRSATPDHRQSGLSPRQSD